jgi:type II secretory pathway component GspD/PulD (secretin)
MMRIGVPVLSRLVVACGLAAAGSVAPRSSAAQPVAASAPLTRPASVPATAPAAPKEAIEYRMLINGDARQMAQVLRELQPILVVVDDRTNSLILKGPATAVSQCVEALNRLESIPSGPPNLIEIHRLKNARARDLAARLQKMSDQGFFGNRNARVIAPRTSGENGLTPPAFAADERTNSLICRFDSPDRQRVQELIEQLDQPAATQPREVVEYRRVLVSDPQKMAAILRQVFDVAADGDERTATVIIKGPPDIVAQAVQLVRHIEDLPTPDLPTDVVFVKQLKNAKAKDLSVLLQNMSDRSYFALPDHRVPPPSFTADERTNALVIHVDKMFEDRVRNIIDELDRSLETK